MLPVGKRGGSQSHNVSILTRRLGRMLPPSGADLRPAWWVSILTRRLGRMLPFGLGFPVQSDRVSILTRRLGRMLLWTGVLDEMPTRYVSILTRRLGRMLPASAWWLSRRRRWFQSSPGG